MVICGRRTLSRLTNGVDDGLMGRHDQVAEVLMGDIAVEEENVDLGSSVAQVSYRRRCRPER